jgi:hypothetical protein
MRKGSDCKREEERGEETRKEERRRMKLNLT